LTGSENIGKNIAQKILLAHAVDITCYIAKALTTSSVALKFWHSA
jgi:hypothetical protein